MAQTNREEGSTLAPSSENFLGTSNETEQISQTIIQSSDIRKRLNSVVLRSSSLKTASEELDTSIVCSTYDKLNTDAAKNERAKANALMDEDCLVFLQLFYQKKVIFIDELQEYIKKPKQWLKLSLLIRADFLETLDSTVRVTPDGISAWNFLSRFKDSGVME